VISMSSIIDEILKSFDPLVKCYGDCTVIVTSDPNKVRGDLGPLATWFHWDAKHESVANLIREYLCARGMRSAGCRENGATYICVFRQDGSGCNRVIENHEST
jgi:hypothetical protein